MDYAVIKKRAAKGAAAPNMLDYEHVRAAFHWKDVEKRFTGLPSGGGLNIAHEAVDRHAEGPLRDKEAIRWLASDGSVVSLSYGRLRELTNRFANALRSLGVGKGNRVFVLMHRRPELYVAALGTLKNGSVFCPLFSAFGPEPIHSRMEIGSGKVLVTTESLYRHKIVPIRESLASLKHVIVVGGASIDGARDYQALIGAQSAVFEIPPTDPEDMALLHFTSGTTGRPKGAMHVHKAALAHDATARFALDLKPDDVFWCTADPGWVTGTSYGIIAPLLIGATMVVDEAEFDAARWYTILQEQRVTNWYTAPTAIRMLMKAGDDLPKKYDLSRVRIASSVGEPLNPEAVVWGNDVLGLPFHDNWWQTETGGIMISNYAAMDIKPGSMGRPLPGIEAAIVERKDDGIQEITKPDTLGELALRPGWPSMFRGYLHEEERYEKCFSGGWYLTGDMATRDAEGYFWFVGRADDVIKSSGHLIGPFEVESALLEHDAVAEAAVIGVPDPVAGEVVKAYVALKHGFEPSDTLRRQILAHARKRLGPAVAPREIVFRDDLPKTRSGKIMRRLLKARELGLPEGDTSTLESNR